MTELINGVGFPVGASLDHFTDMIEVAIKEVHVAAADYEPTPAIYACAPVTESRHQLWDMPVVKIARGCVEFLDREW